MSLTINGKQASLTNGKKSESMLATNVVDVWAKHTLAISVKDGIIDDSMTELNATTATIIITANEYYALPNDIDVSGVESCTYVVEDNVGKIVLTNPTDVVRVNVICEQTEPTIRVDANVVDNTIIADKSTVKNNTLIL